MGSNTMAPYSDKYSTLTKQTDSRANTIYIGFSIQHSIETHLYTFGSAQPDESSDRLFPLIALAQKTYSRTSEGYCLRSCYFLKVISVHYIVPPSGISGLQWADKKVVSWAFNAKLKLPKIQILGSHVYMYTFS
jgi:hypothetical protein